MPPNKFIDSSQIRINKPTESGQITWAIYPTLNFKKLADYENKAISDTIGILDDFTP